MIWAGLVFLLLIACFGAVIFVGAPYLPTLKPQVDAALKLANLKKGQTLLELGCGDGKVLIAAAKQGINVVGYELNPVLVIIAWARTRRYRRNVHIIWGDFWSQPWPEAEAVFVFLLDKYMLKLHTKMGEYPHKPVKLVSFAFQIPKVKPDKVVNGVYLYKYK